MNKLAKVWQLKDFIAVYSGVQVWPMDLLFIKTPPIKQYSYQNDFSGVFDALRQSFLVHICVGVCSAFFTIRISALGVRPSGLVLCFRQMLQSRYNAEGGG